MSSVLVFPHIEVKIGQNCQVGHIISFSNLELKKEKKDDLIFKLKVRHFKRPTTLIVSI